MCGISGAIVTANSRTPPPQLAAIVASQHHRGPDSQGFVRRALADGRSLWLAHNRLSILDLSDEANQPMVSADGRFAMVFNGAIYNYVELRRELEGLGRAFRTSSDTEVLLQAFAEWGRDAFARLLGMFTVAIHDAHSGTLTLARDRFGVKPLYYRLHQDEFWFASTPGAIAQQADLPVDLEYVGRGIRFKYYEDETGIAPFHGLEALPAGHWLTLDGGQTEPHLGRYYDLDTHWRAEAARLAAVSEGDAQSELSMLLDDAVRIRLRADVPIGLSLSGGVDSTSIAALCARLGTPLAGYSFGDPHDEGSESPLVKMLARELGADVRFVPPARGGDAVRLFWQTMRAQGAPVPHTSQMAQYAVFAAARADGVKVMLGGQGGDEAFMGYRKYFLFQLRHLIARRDWRGAPAMFGNIAEILPAIAGKAGLFWRERGRYRADAGAGLDSGLTLPPLDHSPSPGAGLGGDPAVRQALDVTRYSLPSLLRYEDRNSMGNSIESRLPFLDHRVVAFGIGLPTRLKLSRGMGKYLLRQTMRGKVPDAILFNRDKRGFDTHHAAWIAEGIGASIRSAMHQHAQSVAAFLPDGARIDDYFSDARLGGEPARFAEATSLLWLADPSLQSYPA